MRLLFATDGSAGATHAGAWVASLPWESHPAVDVVTVIPERVPFRGPGPPGVIPAWTLIERVRAEEETAAGQLVGEGARLFGAWPPAPETWVQRGQAAAEIARLAGQRHADWIVLGAHGATTAARQRSGRPGASGGGSLPTTLGGVPQSVLKLTPCSVLLVTPGALPPRRLLVAVDLSEHSDRAVAAATSLPLPPDAHAVVLHVREEHPLLQDLAARVPAELQGTLATIAQAQEQAVAAFLTRSEEQLRARGWSVDTEVREGSPAEQILAAAIQHQAEWIVVGARGLSPSPELILGSVSQKVALFNPTTLLVVRG